MQIQQLYSEIWSIYMDDEVRAREDIVRLIRAFPSDIDICYFYLEFQHCYENKNINDHIRPEGITAIKNVIENPINFEPSTLLKAYSFDAAISDYYEERIKKFEKAKNQLIFLNDDNKEKRFMSLFIDIASNYKRRENILIELKNYKEFVNII